MSSLTYRPDVDGLRAIAVLAVLVFHAWPEALPGGFVGVDVFFVLSGYLISGIIYKGCRQGTFTFGDFYARRIRRIFPSLVAMLGLCLAYGWLVLFPSEWRQLGSHAAWGGVFLQNVAFWLESGYFDTSAALKPLLHLWSLAVEEQVYLVFPPVVLLAWRFRWPMLPVLVVLLAASLVACIVTTGSDQSAAFFLTPFRAWEFLAGSILAWVHDRRGVPAVRSWRGEASSWLGLALLGGGLAWISEGAGFPGWRAAIPVAGTTLVLAAGPHATANRWLLSLKPLVWVGLISYPLYLFHWPLLSFLHILKGPKPDGGLVWGAVALSFVLAAAAYYGLEKPIRPSRWKGTVPALLAAFLAIGAAGLGIANGSIPSKPLTGEARLVDQAIAEGEAAWNRYREGFRARFIEGITVARAGGTDRTTLFLGDSTVMMLAPRIRRLVEDEGDGSRGALIVASGGVCPIPGVSHPAKPAQAHLMPVFEDELAADPSIDRVVIGGLWKWFVSPESAFTIGSDPFHGDRRRAAALASLGELIGRLGRSGKRVFVVLSLPYGPELDPRTMYARNLLGGGTLQPVPVAISDAQPGWQAISDDLAAIAAANGAETIDPIPALFRDGIAVAIDEDGPVRSDHLHFRVGFSRDHATYIDRTVSDAPTGAPAPGEEPARPEWRIRCHAGSEAALSTADDGSMRVEIRKRPGEVPWHVQLVGPPVAVEADARYTVSFRARSDAARTVNVLAVEGPPGSAPLGLAREVGLDNEWRDFRFDFVATKTDAAALARFNLGTADASVEFADVEFGPQRWWLRKPAEHPAALASVAGRPGAVRVAIGEGLEPRKAWSLRLHGPPFAVEEGRHFVVSFRARADAPRSIVAKVGLARPPWSSLGFYKVLELTPEWQDFAFRVTPDATVADAQLEFMLGADVAAVEVESVRVGSMTGR